MIYLGHDHTTKGVIPGTNIVCHRIDFPIDPSLTDEQIRHYLVYDKYYDETYTAPKSLFEILNECMLFNVIPVINLNAVWWYKDQTTSKISPEQLARIARHLADYLLFRGFSKKAYIAVFNEPSKFIRKNNSADNAKICQYTNAVHAAVGEDFDIIYGNDEWFNLDWNYLGEYCKAKIMGVHHLSSLGSWKEPRKYWDNIMYAKIVANIWDKQVAGTECGSWFVSYNSEDGNKINLDIMKDCKYYEYLFCLIVMVDVNQGDYNDIVGYRIWNPQFSIWLNESERKYFESWLDYIRKEGTYIMYEAPQKLQAIANYLGFKVGNYEPDLPMVTGTGFWQNSGFAHKRGQSMLKADFDATFEKLIKLMLKLAGQENLADFECYYKQDGSWNPDWQKFAKENVK